MPRLARVCQLTGAVIVAPLSNDGRHLARARESAGEGESHTLHKIYYQLYVWNRGETASGLDSRNPGPLAIRTSAWVLPRKGNPEVDCEGDGCDPHEGLDLLYVAGGDGGDYVAKEAKADAGGN